MRDLQNALSIFHLRNVGIPYNVGGAFPNSGFTLSIPSPAFFYCNLTVDIMLSRPSFTFSQASPQFLFTPTSLHRFANYNARKDHRRASWCIHWLLFSTSHLMCFHPLSCLQAPHPVNPLLNYPPHPPSTPRRMHSYLLRSPPPPFLPTDLTCACETEECMGEPLACKISRYSIFILMLMFYSLLTQIIKLAVEIRLYATFGDYINW